MYPLRPFLQRQNPNGNYKMQNKELRETEPIATVLALLRQPCVETIGIAGDLLIEYGLTKLGERLHKYRLRSDCYYFGNYWYNVFYKGRTEEVRPTQNESFRLAMTEWNNYVEEKTRT